MDIKVKGYDATIHHKKFEEVMKALQSISRTFIEQDSPNFPIQSDMIQKIIDCARNPHQMKIEKSVVFALNDIPNPGGIHMWGKHICEALLEEGWEKKLSNDNVDDAFALKDDAVRAIIDATNPAIKVIFKNPNPPGFPESALTRVKNALCAVGARIAEGEYGSEDVMPSTAIKQIVSAARNPNMGLKSAVVRAVSYMKETYPGKRTDGYMSGDDIGDSLFEKSWREKLSHTERSPPFFLKDEEVSNIVDQIRPRLHVTYYKYTLDLNHKDTLEYFNGIEKEQRNQIFTALHLCTEDPEGHTDNDFDYGLKHIGKRSNATWLKFSEKRNAQANDQPTHNLD